MFIFDRSNLDEIVAVRPAKDGKPREEITRRQDLERGFPRNDVVLFNGLRTKKQYLLYVSETGFSGDLFLLDFLTDEQFTKLEEIAEKMRNNAREFPPAKKLIVPAFS